MSTIYLMILLTSLGIVTSALYIYAALTGALFLAFFTMQQVCVCGWLRGWGRYCQGSALEVLLH